jgi:hypothetical protein
MPFDPVYRYTHRVSYRESPPLQIFDTPLKAVSVDFDSGLKAVRIAQKGSNISSVSLSMLR